MSNPPPKLLVADDEEAILQEYRRIFDPAQPDQAGSAAMQLETELFGAKPAAATPGFELATCRQGDDAVAVFRKALEEGNPFPVVYLDVRMPPGPNGIEAARAIRALDPHVHIAIITGYSDVAPEKIVELVQPVDRLFYFEKPFRGVELRQLAIALNAKWHAERALEAARDHLEQQVAERTAQLSKAKDAAERASSAKTTFLANMSHELRTPLNAIIGFSDLILEETHGPVGEPRYQEYVRDIHTSGNHLLHLINGILELAKAERGKLTLREQPFALEPIIADALRFVRPHALKSGISLRHVVSAEIGEIYADPDRILEVLTNLLSNAVKFTPPGGAVTAEAAFSPAGALVIKVSDTGIGIRAEDIPKALEPFVQVDHGLNRQYPGTGLGLPLAIALVEQHGGQLSLESRVGVGTTVTLTFPKGRTAPARADGRAPAADLASSAA